jgi:hypothetical protein
MTTIKITYDKDDQPVKEEISHPQDAGFTVGKIHIKHSCGKFASSGAGFVGAVSRTFYKCEHCGVTVLSFAN